MVTCRIVLAGDLPDLAAGRREIRRRLPAPTSLKDALEALGIPHGEVGRVTCDGRPASLADPVTDGVVIKAFPTEPFDLADPRFLCDHHLGKLARLLRFCGLDTRWQPTWREATLARVAAQERRTILSRHRALLKRSTVLGALLVRSDHADRQLVEVLRRYRLADRLTRPGRCTRCNGLLVATDRDRVPVPIPPRTAAWREDYWICAGCGQLFWDGTHAERLRERVARARTEASR